MERAIRRFHFSKNVNLFLCLMNYALRHEDMRVSGGLATLFLTSGALPLRKSFQVPTGYEAGCRESNLAVQPVPRRYNFSGFPSSLF
jgi:hypothetical protein